MNTKVPTNLAFSYLLAEKSSCSAELRMKKSSITLGPGFGPYSCLSHSSFLNLFFSMRQLGMNKHFVDRAIKPQTNMKVY